MDYKLQEKQDDMKFIIEEKINLFIQEKINSWEMIEGSKSATSICYSWFCAKKTERKRLRYEEQYRLLLRHKHNVFDKSLTYFRV